MIGVACEEDERAAVSEFFELFKTPWEFYQATRSYDVLVSSVTTPPEADARLWVIYNSQPTSLDEPARLDWRDDGGHLITQNNVQLPIYKGLATFRGTAEATVCATRDNAIAGFSRDGRSGQVVRLGYGLFREVDYLLNSGQPREHALIPTLDLHIAALRHWILGAGISLVEVPPAPYGSPFVVCLTHDIDFIGIRQHRFDHTMWGFLYRSTAGAVLRLCRGRLRLRDFARSLRAAARLPLVHAGICEDFWSPFAWYLAHEANLSATYFLVPFKRRPGKRVSARHRERRATAYDVGDLGPTVRQLTAAGCEIGVHGIDAWHDVTHAVEERERVQSITGGEATGIRMHWLLRSDETPRVLEEAGYSYDATFGYNETAGYRAGTTQVFKPSGTRHLLELPLHIQDGALFYPGNLDLRESDASELCSAMLQHAQANGGALTTLWHDRSHAPERFWGDFYVGLLDELRACNPWFATGSDCVEWFRARRSIKFQRSDLNGDATAATALASTATPTRPFALRFHQPLSGDSTNGAQYTDVPWSGADNAELAQLAAQDVR